VTGTAPANGTAAPIRAVRRFLTGIGAALTMTVASAHAASASPPLPQIHPNRDGPAAPANVQINTKTEARAKPKPKAGTTAEAAGDQPIQPPASSTSADPETKTPRYLTKREAAFRKDVSEMVADLAALDVSDADKTALIQSATASRKGRLSEALAKRDAIKDPALIKLANWVKLIAGFGTPDEYASFLRANPLWPDRQILRRRMEDAAFTQGGTVREIETLFAKSPPQTGPGLAALASARLARGDKTGAHKLASDAWRNNRISSTLETGFLERFAKILTPQDHRARVDYLLSHRFARRSRRNARANAVRRTLPLLTEADQKLATVRLALYLGQSGTDKMIASLPEAARQDRGLARQRAQQDTRSKRFEAAAKRLIKLPAGSEAASPDADWLLRYRVMDALLEAGKPKPAYDVIKTAWPDDENDRKEAAFLSGWIALRHLNKPDAAVAHFKRMVKAADGPLSRSKANYWLARALAAADKPETAKAAFQQAGGYLDTFHGALARVALDPPERALVLPMPDRPSASDVARFKSRDVIRAGVLAHKAGLKTSYLRNLFGDFAWRVSSGAEIMLSAQLAELLGDTQVALRAGKAGVARGHPHYIYSYPVHKLPDFEPLRPPPPAELLFAIARQESEFNTRIVSRAGARGVLQVMPITARHVCQIYKIRCTIRDLLRDESYNARIAAAYIADQADNVDNNMILTLTGYNAGPGRTRQWLRERGDPRTAKIDPLDWVYRIPFEETRLYVQKVLSNMQVFRARLGRDEPVRVDRDLGLADTP